jgi:integrase
VCRRDRDRVSQALKGAAGMQLYPLIVLGAATGCRRGELLALTWSDVDFESGIMTVDKSLEETKAGLRVKSTKSGKARRFAVPAQALQVLQQHRAQQDRDRALFGKDYSSMGLVFCKPEGTFYRPDSISSRVTEILRKAGLTSASLHTLRHSHASELLSKGAPIPTVAKRLGHANANVTLSIYSHALEADELAAAKIWDDAMADVIETNTARRVKCAG